MQHICNQPELDPLLSLHKGGTLQHIEPICSTWTLFAGRKLYCSTYDASELGHLVAHSHRPFSSTQALCNTQSLCNKCVLFVGHGLSLWHRQQQLPIRSPCCTETHWLRVGRLQSMHKNNELGLDPFCIIFFAGHGISLQHCNTYDELGIATGIPSLQHIGPLSTTYGNDNIVRDYTILYLFYFNKK